MLHVNGQEIVRKDLQINFFVVLPKFTSLGANATIEFYRNRKRMSSSINRVNDDAHHDL